MANNILLDMYLYFRSLFFILIIFIFTFITVKLIKDKWRMVYLAMKLPGPRAYPLIGNALKFACKPDELLECVKEVIMPYVDQTPIRLWMGPQLYIVVIEPRDIEMVLNSQQAASKGDVYKFFNPFIGNGLLSGSGKTWKSYRKLLMHIMNQRLFDSFVEVFDRRSEELIDKLIPLSNGEAFDILKYMELCTTNIVCETIMGHTSIDALNDPDHEFIHYSAEMYNIVANRMMKVWLHPDWIFKMTPNYLKQCQAQKIIRSFTELCITERNQEIDKGLLATSVLQKLLKTIDEKHELNYEELGLLGGEIYTVYMAAQDTLAVVSSFALLMLGIHQDVQSKARLEVDDVISEEAITSEHLPKLKYIEMIIKETLRLFPIAPLLVRRLNDELKLENCVLPKGGQVVLAPYVTHRYSKYWDMPNQFIPERFMLDKKQIGSFIPFSSGLMGCIGNRYAVMCLKTLLANILKKFTVESNIRLDEIKLKTDISIRSVNGYKIALQLRNDDK